MSSTAYKVRLENIFEGPMDLLVHLIKKNQVDICDIPIALITDQFLSYIQWMQDMEIDVAADFLVMAATLTQIKSRMLLPAPESDDEETEDPRDAIAGPLAEYMRMKSAAGKLGERFVLGDHVFCRPREATNAGDGSRQASIEGDLFELVRLYQEIIGRLSPELGFSITAEKISVREKMTAILDLLETRKKVTFADLAAQCADKGEIIATFLAILEVVRLNLVGITQTDKGNGLQLFSR